MALIKSISGIRGTIGGTPGEGLTPLDVVKFTAAYGAWICRQESPSKTAGRKKIVVGRDGRISGAMVRDLVVATLTGMGLDVTDLGLSTTPTVEMAVVWEGAAGGIILTASHNPKEWNALKLLNEKGEFISAQDGAWILETAEKGEMQFAEVGRLGQVRTDESYGQKHIDAILAYPLVDAEAIRRAGFKVVVDAINSTGAIWVPKLLEALGVEKVQVMNEDVTGNFAHNPEPLPEHLRDLCKTVEKSGADLGIAVDPDVDRLCFVNEDGSLFGEEYTLVAVADYVLSQRPGNTVSNLSSTRALRDVTEAHGGHYYGAAVGEVNVVAQMKAVDAVIGGEGNGGIIVPDLHYGRDALIGIALFLTQLAKTGKSIGNLRSKYPAYFISKNKIALDPKMPVADVFASIKGRYKKQPVNEVDGLKIEFDTDWVHLRTSNTEPIIRIYAESTSETTAANIAKRLMADIKEAMKEAGL